jgi:hypothetical protein
VDLNVIGLPYPSGKPKKMINMLEFDALLNEEYLDIIYKGEIQPISFTIEPMILPVDHHHRNISS